MTVNCSFSSWQAFRFKGVQFLALFAPSGNCKIVNDKNENYGAYYGIKSFKDTYSKYGEELNLTKAEESLWTDQHLQPDDLPEWAFWWGTDDEQTEEQSLFNSDPEREEMEEILYAEHMTQWRAEEAAYEAQQIAWERRGY